MEALFDCASSVLELNTGREKQDQLGRVVDGCDRARSRFEPISFPRSRRSTAERAHRTPDIPHEDGQDRLARRAGRRNQVHERFPQLYPSLVRCLASLCATSTCSDSVAAHEASTRTLPLDRGRRRSSRTAGSGAVENVNPPPTWRVGYEDSGLSERARLSTVPNASLAPSDLTPAPFANSVLFFFSPSHVSAFSLVNGLSGSVPLLLATYSFLAAHRIMPVVMRAFGKVETARRPNKSLLIFRGTCPIGHRTELHAPAAFTGLAYLQSGTSAYFGAN